MKNIKLVVTAVIVMAAMSVSGQWTDTGDYTYTNDAIGIGFATNPSSAIKFAANGPAYINGPIFGSRINAYSPSNRFDFGWGATGGSNLEFYSNDHATSPGQMRFVFGKENKGNINYLHYNGTDWTSCLFVNHDGKVGVGTSSPASTLDVRGDISANNFAANGKITTKEVEVTLDGWSDYVFEENYELRPLSEVEAFINEHKHLPGVPSEKEVLENGLSVGQMNKKMMEKIEELTLYVIELQKEVERLKDK